MSNTSNRFLMAAAGGKKSTYVDDVFSTYLYVGNMTDRDINTGIDLAGEGGLTWIYVRTGSAGGGWLFDTERGYNKFIRSSDSLHQGTETTMVSGFTNTGFSLDGDGGQSDNTNNNGADYVSWNFRKAPGFFDVVTYNGNATNRTIPHSLGCVPGCILIKRTDVAADWMVYHRSLNGGNSPSANRLHLNTNVGEAGASTVFNETEPTSTEFSLGTHYDVNGNNGTFVAYLFAGGEANLASVSGARCVVFDGGGDGNNDYLEIPNSSDFSFGSGDFTIEGWFKINNVTAASGIIGVWNYSNNRRSWNVQVNNSGGLEFMVSTNGSSDSSFWTPANSVSPNQWTHFAAVRDGNTLRLFLNGTEENNLSFSGSLYNNTDDKCQIGITNSAANALNGELSNIRVIKGTALYTSSFKAPTQPLTNITNTKLLCCNNESRSGSTVTPATITAEGNPVARYYSPFDDPEGFVFGKSGEENIVKTGGYNGAGGWTTVNIGWQPQWVLVKRTDSSQNWFLWDTMRGWFTGVAGDKELYPNTTSTEYTYGTNFLETTSTGFRVDAATGHKFIFVAIRNSDGYVGKPPEASTDVFAMDTGNNSSVGPAFDSNFAVDFALLQQPASAGLDWRSFARLTGTKSLATNTNASETTESHNTSDYNDGFADSYTNAWQSWMWKRGAGFDVVAYTGDGVAGRQIRHSLNKAAEMILVKRRDTSGNGGDWMVGHKGLDGGSSPWNEYLVLNKTQAEMSDYNPFNNVAPTTTSFQLSDWDRVNGNNSTYIAMLFASVDGISKVGSYDGTGVSGLTVTTGFTPRFLIIKNYTWSHGDWFVYDTTRGWAAGTNGEVMQLNSTGAQSNSGTHKTSPTSTGFSVDSTDTAVNASGQKFIYYAHA